MTCFCPQSTGTVLNPLLLLHINLLARPELICCLSCSSGLNARKTGLRAYTIIQCRQGNYPDDQNLPIKLARTRVRKKAANQT